VGAIAEIGFAQGPQKLNDGSGKTNYPGTMDRGFTVYENVLNLFGIFTSATKDYTSYLL
jgi:hypothetical protein